MDAQRGRPPAEPEQRRTEAVRVLLSADEKTAALRLAGAVPLATWVYGLVRAELERGK